MDIKSYLAAGRTKVDQALESFLPDDPSGGVLVSAMRYSLFAGGKRLRPILCLAGAEAVSGLAAPVMYCACALEMIHTYSLVHDDLPAMDDDDLRRGKPTSHTVYGEGMALLAGDGLLTQAMVLLTDAEGFGEIELDRVLAASNEIMRAAGLQGMVMGQAADLAAENQEPDLATVEFIHANKTGALITASLVSGGILAGGGEDQVEALRGYGRRVGLAFQIADDLLDLEGDAETLGKAIGMDAERGKMTYPGVVGAQKAREQGWRLVGEAAAIATGLGPKAEPLAVLAAYIMERTK